MQKAVIYYRVSTEEQAQHGISLEQQKNQCLAYAQQNNIEVIEYFHDDGVSAKTIERPSLQKLLTYCRRNYKNIDCVIIYKIDRLSRNVNDYSSINMLLTKLSIQLISTTESIDKTPTGKFIGHIMAANAQLDNDIRSERVSSCMRERLKSGVWCHKAPIGYLNSRNTQGQKTIKLDRKKAKLIKWAFEEFAKGIYTLEEVRRTANKKGLCTEKGKEISFQLMSKMIKNTFYYGQMYARRRNEYWPGTHKTIISKETYYKCQEILSRKKERAIYKTKKEVSRDFPLRNFVCCAYCDRPLTASYSTGKFGGKFPYYRCYNKECSKLQSIPKEKIENDFMVYIEQIIPKKQVLESSKDVLLDIKNNKFTEINKHRKDAKKALIKLLEEKKELIAMRRKGPLDDDDFKEALQDVKIQISKAQSQKNGLHLKELISDQVINEAFELISFLPEMWGNADYEQKIKIQSSIFLEKPNYDKNTFGTPQLSLLLAKNKGSEGHDSSYVNYCLTNWNSLIDEIRRWHHIRHIN